MGNDLILTILFLAVLIINRLQCPDELDKQLKDTYDEKR